MDFDPKEARCIVWKLVKRGYAIHWKSILAFNANACVWGIMVGEEGWWGLGLYAFALTIYATCASAYEDYKNIKNRRRFAPQSYDLEYIIYEKEAAFCRQNYGAKCEYDNHWSMMKIVSIATILILAGMELKHLFSRI